MGSTTEAQRAVRRREVAKRLRLGESYAEISDALDVSKSTIARDVRRLKEQWREEAQGDMEDHIARRFAELRAVKREAYSAWLDSREDPTREKIKTSGSGEEVTTVGEDGGLNTEAAVTDVDEITKEVTRKAGGDPRHLQVMLDAETKIQKLLGVHDYDTEGEGDRLDSLVNVMEKAAEEYDPQQFEDEEIR